MKKITMILLLAFFLLGASNVKGYNQNDSVVEWTICSNTNSCTVYKFIVSDNQNYWENYVNRGGEYNSLSSTQKQYYVSAYINTYYIKNNFSPLY